jgi:hypothetical protein
MAIFALSACDNGQQASQTNRDDVKVRSSEQGAVASLEASTLRIGLKHAIYDAGYTRASGSPTRAFVGASQETFATCGWRTASTRKAAQSIAIRRPDGSAQVRNCRDIPAPDSPCEIKQRPKGSFTEVR